MHDQQNIKNIQGCLEWTGRADIMDSLVVGSISDGFFVWEQVKDQVYSPFPANDTESGKKVGSRAKWSIQASYGEFKRMPSVALPLGLKWIEAACTTCCKYDSPIFQNNFPSRSN